MTTRTVDLAIEGLVTRLAATHAASRRTRLVRELLACGDPWLAAERLKAEAERARYLDVDASLAWTSAIRALGALAGDETIVALGAMTEALTVFEQDRYIEALALFDQASDLFRANGHELGWARAQIARTSACLALARFDEALLRAEEARGILAAAGDTRRVAAIDNNLALLLERMNR